MALPSDPLKVWSSNQRKVSGMSDLQRPIQPMPEIVETALREANLSGQYAARPPYQRNDYLWWINSAKRDDTKRRRLSKMLAELKAGSGYMGMDWKPKS